MRRSSRSRLGARRRVRARLRPVRSGGRRLGGREHGRGGGTRGGGRRTARHRLLGRRRDGRWARRRRERRRRRGEQRQRSRERGRGGRGLDADGGPCGQPGEPCCTGATACQGGGCCSAGACVARGASPTTTQVCIDGTLVACGGGGIMGVSPAARARRAAPSDAAWTGTCVAAGQTCGGTPNLGLCANAACGACGGDGDPCCTGAPGGQGDGRELLHDVGRRLRAGDEQVHGLRRQRAAVLRRRVVRRRRVLRPDGEDVRREHRDVWGRPGQVLERGVRERRLRRDGRTVLRGRRRVHRAVLRVPGQRVRRVRGHRPAVLPREQRGRRVVQRRRGVLVGRVRRVRGHRAAVLRRRRVQGGRLRRGEVPVSRPPGSRARRLRR